MILFGLAFIWGGLFLVGTIDGSGSPSAGEPPRAILTRLVPSLLMGAACGVATALGAALGWTWPVGISLVGALVGFLAYVFGLLLGFALWSFGLFLRDGSDDSGNLGGLLGLHGLVRRVVRRRFGRADPVADTQFQGFQASGKLPGRHRFSDSDGD